MFANKTRWLLVAVLCLALWPAHASAQGGLWETYMAAGDKAYHKGNYPEAEKQWVAAVKEAEGFGPQDPRLATSLNNLGEVYLLQRRYAEAEPLLKRALVIREKALGPEQLQLAMGLEDYAALLRETGRSAEAAEHGGPRRGDSGQARSTEPGKLTRVLVVELEFPEGTSA